MVEEVKSEPLYYRPTYLSTAHYSTNTRNELFLDNWTDAVGYIPPYPIFSNRTGDQGLQFIDLNGDGRMDFVYHLWTPNQVYKGAYINDPDTQTFIPATNFEPPHPIASSTGKDLGTRL